MVRTTILALIGATALLSPAANAADLPPPLPPPMIQPVPVVTSGWYLRGDVGVGQKSFSDFQHHQTNPAFIWPASWRIDQKDMADTAFIGFGVGYAWNNWLRFDVTGEYRMKEAFRVTGSYTEFCPGGRCFDVYEGHHSNWLVLANAYVDLGTWWCITPFIGAGVGGSYNKISGFRDDGVSYSPLLNNSVAYFADNGKWNLAWAAHAGLAYKVNPGFTVELAYSYMNLGDAAPGNFRLFDNSASGPTSIKIKELTSHDVKLGVRWDLNSPPVYAPPPLVTKG
jgi:opacity protein-like surface antigen